MNILTQTLGLVLNLLTTPLALSNNCGTFLLKSGDSELKVALVPRGYCPNCCPIRSNIDIRYILYNKNHRIKGQQINPNQPELASKSGLISNISTIIFIHGFTEPSPGQSGRAMIDAYLGRPEDYNVILLDWSEIGAFPWYTSAVRNVKHVATSLAKFLENYHDNGQIPIGNVHLIGFSLGAHIAGFSGKLLRYNLRIPRITALDPAYPEYSLKDTSRRLSRTDAEFVAVIHTDSGVLGLPIPIGHADFYPNGGKSLQPGCQPSYLARIRLLDQILGCSHVRAWQLYEESIRNPSVFPATKCRQWRGPNKTCNFTQDALMGYNCSTKTRGQFYLMTGHKAPFGRSIKQQL